MAPTCLEIFQWGTRVGRMLKHITLKFKALFLGNNCVLITKCSVYEMSHAPPQICYQWQLMSLLAKFTEHVFCSCFDSEPQHSPVGRSAVMVIMVYFS